MHPQLRHDLGLEGATIDDLLDHRPSGELALTRWTAESCAQGPCAPATSR
jgi:hypothetical protein